MTDLLAATSKVHDDEIDSDRRWIRATYKAIVIAHGGEGTV